MSLRTKIALALMAALVAGTYLAWGGDPATAVAAACLVALGLMVLLG